MKRNQDQDDVSNEILKMVGEKINLTKKIL